MLETNRQILLVSRPERAAVLENFRLVQAKLSPLKEGEVRIRNHFLSLDPYMRGRMDERKSYAPPQQLGEVMQGGTAGVVIESRNPEWQSGDHVVAMFGWQEYGTSNGTDMRKVDTANVPLSAYLGAVGMPGVTAWYGLNRICAPKAGETVAVSAASGAVGSVVGQLAKRHGCRVVGIAGGPEKCRYLVEELGFDQSVDYRAGMLAADLAEAAPLGIDCYFDNVGGVVLDAVMERMNAHGRIAVCGAIAGYDGTPLTMANPALILRSRLKLQGFIVSEHMEDWPAALKELSGLVAAGQLRYRESVAVGLEAAPEALLGLLKGRNFGKQIVKLV
ncbi:MAG: NADP-dependent oxidoreductase [Acetobacteraceae bacterium]